MHLMNQTDIAVTVPVLDPQGNKDSVNLQPRGRADLGEGYKVDPFHEATVRKSVKLVDPGVKIDSMKAVRSAPEQAGQSAPKDDITDQGSALKVDPPATGTAGSPAKSQKN